MEALLGVPLPVLMKGPIEALEPLPPTFKTAHYFAAFKPCIVEEMRAAVVSGLQTHSASVPVRHLGAASGDLTDRASLRITSRSSSHNFRNGDALLLLSPNDQSEDQLSQALSHMALSDRSNHSGSSASGRCGANVLGVVTGCRGDLLELAIGRGNSRLDWVPSKRCTTVLQIQLNAVPLCSRCS